MLALEVEQLRVGEFRRVVVDRPVDTHLPHARGRGPSASSAWPGVAERPFSTDAGTCRGSGVKGFVPTTRSRSSLLKMSNDLSPLSDCSTTMGMLYDRVPSTTSTRVRLSQLPPALAIGLASVRSLPSIPLVFCRDAVCTCGHVWATGWREVGRG